VRQDRVRDCLGRWRTAWNLNVDRKKCVERTSDLSGGAKDSATQGAIAESRNQARLGHRLIGCSQRLGHTSRHWSGDEQDIGVTRRGNDVEPKTLQVVLGRCRSSQLVLASVAGSCIDVADCQRAGTAACGKSDVATNALEMTEQDEHDQRSTHA
jgi:hypothetical protein